MSSIDSGVVMIFLVLPISTHDYSNRGWNGSAIHVSTLENPGPGFPLLMLKLNASYHAMTPVTLSSTNVDSSRPETHYIMFSYGGGVHWYLPLTATCQFSLHFAALPHMNCKYLWLFIHYSFIITPYPCYPSFSFSALTKNGSCKSISNVSVETYYFLYYDSYYYGIITCYYLLYSSSHSRPKIMI